MNWMDSGDYREVKQRQNKLENRKIEFDRVEVDYNISIAELLVLSAEKAGYDARIEKTNDSTNVEILIPYLVNGVDDCINIKIFKDIYYVECNVEIEGPKNIEEECNLLRYINGGNNSGFVQVSTICDSDEWYINFMKNNYRVVYQDENIKRLELSVKQSLAIMDHDDDLYYNIKTLKGKLDVYYEQDLDFNLSGGWNASEGYEMANMLDSINYLIRCVQEERENLLEFIKKR